MKKCRVCTEEFADDFVFCPIDGKPLAELTKSLALDFKLTVIADACLSQRLWFELQFVLEEIKRSWPDFKAEPIGFLLGALKNLAKETRQTLARPHAISAVLTAIVLLTAAISGALLLERHSPKRIIRSDDSSEVIQPTIFNFRHDATPKTGTGVGAGEQGRVGVNSGKGEGSGPEPAKSHGGGSGGNGSPNPSSVGKVPPPSEIPAPISTTYARLVRALPEAGLNIDPVLWKDLPYPNYGDPRSKSTTPSNGPGEGGGVGTNKGPGIGEGDGPGFGPGGKGNIGGGDKGPGCCGIGGSAGNNPDPGVGTVYSSNDREVTTRPHVLSKPEAQYTEEARRANISGVVILRVVFSSTGEVTNIHTIQKLPFGLTEKAIAAARQIKFAPATRGGRPVSVYMQLEYNFNLY